MSCELDTCYWMKPFFWGCTRGRRCHPIVGVLIGHQRIAAFSPQRRLGNFFRSCKPSGCFVRVQGNMSSLWYFTQLFVLGWVVGFWGKTHLILTRNKKIVSGKKTWRPCDGTVSICVTEQRNTEYFGGLVVKYMTHTEGTYINLCQKFLQIALSNLFLCWLVYYSWLEAGTNESGFGTMRNSFHQD